MSELDELLRQQRVEQLLFLEGRLIDERRFAEWEALWIDEGIYWVPANGEDTNPHTQVSLVYDNQSRMHNRVERYVGGQAISQQPPPRTVHLVSNVFVETPVAEVTSDDPMIVHSALQVAESRPGARVDWVASVTHHLVDCEGDLRFAFKKVVLVDNDQELTTIDFLL
ncbi:MAG: aromatic-ring-hydroxylating dioxygenase subunit beta [Actinomycetota bacterium]|jgi:benzoate/toluate 1,2-dioxygenase subunit beta|nr:aromatic-ring-hydroxylating dioxygenase subunit beta [Actinomycetota bacterium]